MPLRILLVENNLLDQRAFTRFVTREGLSYDYTIANSVDASLRILQEELFDIVLVDYMLDDGTGFDVIPAVPADIPIVFITGTGSEEIAIESMRQGAQDYLIKDIDREYLKLLPLVIERSLHSKKEEKKQWILSHAIMDSSENIIITDLMGIITFVNSAFCRAYEYTEDEIIGQRCTVLYPAEKDIFEQENLRDYECINLKKDGTSFPVAISRSKILDDQGQAFAYFVATRDITERKLAVKREIEIQLEKERLSLLAAFVRNAAHEFKTPLTVISNYAYLIARSEAQQKRSKQAEQIEQQVARIDKLVDTLTFMVELQSLQTITFLEFNLNDVAKSARVPLASNRREGSPIKYELQPNLPLVRGNALHITKAIEQVLDNACRYTPANGEIVVESGFTVDQVWLRVRDNGIGISEKSMAQIFETFWRNDQAHSTPGFGLGLPIVKKIMELHGGKINVESSEGSGTTVCLWLPMA